LTRNVGASRALWIGTTHDDVVNFSAFNAGSFNGMLNSVTA
jgi:hypothetical protein